LRTPEGYTLTALTAFDAAKRVAAGEVETVFKRRAVRSVPFTSSRSTA
jgi:hypothetical protein